MPPSINREEFIIPNIVVYDIQYLRIMEDFLRGYQDILETLGKESRVGHERHSLFGKWLSRGKMSVTRESLLTVIRTLFHTPFLQGIAPAHGAAGQVFHPSKSPLHQDSCCQIRAEPYMAIHHGLPILIEPVEVIPEAI